MACLQAFVALRPVLDLDGDGVAADAALIGDAEQRAGEVDADAPGLGGRGALDPFGVVERRAGLAVDVAGDQGDAALRIAILGLDFFEGVQGRITDLEGVDGEIAEAEVEDLVEVLIVACELGVFGVTP